MKKYKKACPGDCVVSVALSEGLVPDDVWNHPDNDHLRKDPDRDVPEIVKVGQKIHLPEKTERKEQRAQDEKHTFKKSDVPVHLRVTLLDNGEPRDNRDYVFEVNAQTRKGKTDDHGVLDEIIPFDATEATVRLKGEDDGETYIFKLGFLQPVHCLNGVQARLHNLGYNTGPVDNLMGPITERAIKVFQRDEELEITGEPNDETLDALLERHAC